MIRILAKSVRENKKYSIIAPILVFFQAMTNVAVPFLMGDLIDKGIMKGNLTYICHLGLLLSLQESLPEQLLAGLPEGQRLDFRRTCGMIYSIIFSNFHLKILITSQAQV